MGIEAIGINSRDISVAVGVAGPGKGIGEAVIISAESIEISI